MAYIFALGIITLAVFHRGFRKIVLITAAVGIFVVVSYAIFGVANDKVVNAHSEHVAAAAKPFDPDAYLGEPIAKQH